MAQQGSSYRWGVGATLVILAMSLALACSSDPDPKKGGGGSAPPGCATLCAGFSQGLNCTASAQGQCLDGCSDVAPSCPELLGPLAECIGQLAIECVAEGYAVAHSRSGEIDAELLESPAGTLEVQDPECAERVEDFLKCEVQGGGCATVSCTSPAVADCASGSCIAPVSSESSNEACANGMDDNGNGYVDCDDFHCVGNPDLSACGETETNDARCSDGSDNDGNGFTDCDDVGCRISPSVTVCPGERGSECSDGIDNDGNDYVDCADHNCFGSPFADCQR